MKRERIKAIVVDDGKKWMRDVVVVINNDRDLLINFEKDDHRDMAFYIGVQQNLGLPSAMPNCPERIHLPSSLQYYHCNLCRSLSELGISQP